MISLRFVAGTLEVDGLERGTKALPAGCAWDGRTACHRAEAYRYAEVVRSLIAAEVPYEDEARAYEDLESGARAHEDPRGYQREALDAWRRESSRGVVVLPTGSGKTLVAILAIDARRRSTLVVAPTLDLVRQWYDALRRCFDRPVGVIGGGEHQVEALTVTTYDSAYIHMDRLGARFGLVVFDECHHLPSESYALAARACLAPFRLGLTATPDRDDGRDVELDDLIGPVAYEKTIVEMSGAWLSDYDTRRIVVALSEPERREYESERAIYLGFLRQNGIRMGSPRGWNDFIIRSARSEQGRRAMGAYQRQRAIAFAAPAKLDQLDHLLHRHRQDRTIVFTQDNATAYEISRRFLVPVITHRTKVTERSHILSGLSEGVYGAVVTSKVLNEGVDVPSANVAVVISGSGSVREHVQRLGRILRKQEGKHAVLYELVTEHTTETGTSERRRSHDAYR